MMNSEPQKVKFGFDEGAEFGAGFVIGVAGMSALLLLILLTTLKLVD